jgi:PAS domain-containing protein
VTEVLNAAEQAELAQLETVIERGMNTFVDVGNALAAINDQKLYRADHETFEAYCRQRWNVSRPRAYELMAAAEAVSGIPDTLPKPGNAGQAVALARIPEARRTEVWEETVARTGGNPTAAAVQQTYAARADEVVEAEIVAEPEAPRAPKRRPLPEAFADAGRDLNRAAEKLTRLTEDDRFGRNRDATHHQVPELLQALEHTTRLITAMNLPAADASEEARRWWATSLHDIADALTDVANSIQKEQ